MQILDLQKLNFGGIQLIEASAGTGKTYTIAMLFLRALLNDFINNPFKSDILLDNVLAVTFTNAATEELRQRVRSTVHSALARLQGEDIDDSTIKALVDNIDDKALAAKRLYYGLHNIDQAKIFTIHGFCNKLLREQAFESGQNFDFELTLDESELIHSAALDFWRKYIVSLPLPILEVVTAKTRVKSLQTLISTITPLLNKSVLKFLPTSLPDNINKVFEELESLVKKLKQEWHTQDIPQLLAAACKKNRLQGKAENIAYMEKFVLSDSLMPNLGTKNAGWEAWTPEVMAKALIKSKSDCANNTFFVLAQQAAEQSTYVLTCAGGVIIKRCLEYVKNWLSNEKLEHNTLSPDDLLKQCLKALSHHRNSALLERLRKQYPIAFIDEFQDTDAIQYQIFYSLYKEQVQCGVFFIGDPKQAIYAFRGADINTYLLARSAIPPNQRYDLNTNWRSTDKMINAVNDLFTVSKKSFSSDETFIYHPVKASGKFNHCIVNESNQEQQAIECLHLENQTNSLNSREQFIETAAQLNAERIATLLKTGTIAESSILAKDITVLVRDKKEARAIKVALTKRNINSVYLAKESVLSSMAASDLYYVLRAIVTPQDGRFLRSALASTFFAYDEQTLAQVFEDGERWQEYEQLFFDCQTQWHKFGIMTAVFNLVTAKQLTNYWFRNNWGERYATDIRHILELFDNANIQAQSLNWQLQYYMQLRQAKYPQLEAEQLRLENEAELIKIETIHASKGLEYPIVFLPFVAWSRIDTQALYTDPETLATVCDFEQQTTSISYAEQEQRHEDVRLLYVALTRAKYFCSFTLLNTKPLAQTALSFILQSDTNTDYDRIFAQLESLPTITMRCVDNCALSTLDEELAIDVLPAAKPFTATINRNWAQHSYTSLSKGLHFENEHHEHDESDMSNRTNQFQPNTEALNPLNFPAGAHTGILLHNILENINFTSTDNDRLVICENSLSAWSDPLTQEYSKASLADFLTQWISTIVTTPLNKHKLSLASISNEQRINEMEFYLPLASTQLRALNDILTQFGYPKITITQQRSIEGLFKGFIDLVFEHKGKVYIIDYKSNMLGHDTGNYQQQNLQKAIDQELYFLQYLIYSVAVCRYCESRQLEFDYDKHFGGIYYLFLRGMSPQYPLGSGVFFDRPSAQLIDELSALFVVAKVS